MTNTNTYHARIKGFENFSVEVEVKSPKYGEGYTMSLEDLPRMGNVSYDECKDWKPSAGLALRLKLISEGAIIPEGVETIPAIEAFPNLEEDLIAWRYNDYVIEESKRALKLSRLIKGFNYVYDTPWGVLNVQRAKVGSPWTGQGPILGGTILEHKI